MNCKTGKRILGWLCAATLLCGAISTNGIVALATDAATETSTGVEFYDAAGQQIEDAQYSLHGVTYDATQEIFVRMDSETAATIANTNSLYNDEGAWVNTVYSLAREAAGGRIRFNTDSATIKIEAELFTWDASHVSHGSSMAAAKYGFDVYVESADGSTYAGTVVGETKDEDGDGKVDPGTVLVNDTITFEETASRDITIYFPITIETKSVKISVAEGCTVTQHQNVYEGDGRIVFYGSSITQGGAVTKPGNTYVNTVGRNLNMEYLDLGMWGRCKGETAFAEYIAGLGDVSAFVYDYDHNESYADTLAANHYAFYEIIREAYPDIPIIMMTRPGSGLDNSKAQDPTKGYSTTAEMKAVIRESYETAKASGDKNVHFVDGETFFGYSKAYMADNAHPNDAGQAKMAEVVTAVFEQIFAGAENLCVEPASCNEELLMNEDFTGEEDGTTAPEGWKTSSSSITVGAATTITETDGNKAYQFEFTRDSGGSIMTLYPDSTFWSDGSDSAVEMDVELHKTLYVYETEGTEATEIVFPMLGLKIGETPCSSAKQKFEIRFRPFSNRYTVYLYDGTNGTNPSDPIEYQNVYDQSFIDMYEKEDIISFNLRVETKHVTRDGSDSVDISVLVNGTHVAGFNFQPQDGFEPNHFRLFCYGTKTGVNHKAIVDNIKAYSISTHTLSLVPEVPATTDTAGTKAHYVCSECNKKFLDEKGIIEVTDADLVIAQGCVKMLFSDDFENGDSNWSLYRNYYPEDTEAGTFGIVEDENGNAVYQMLVTRDSSSVSNYINVAESILAGYSDYTIEMKGTMYQAGDKWPYMSVRLRDSSSTGYEIQIQPTTEGYNLIIRDRTSGNIATTFLIEDANLSSEMDTGKVSYDLRAMVDHYVTDDNVKKVKFQVYIGDNEPVEFDMEPANPEITVTRLFVYLSSGSAKTTTYKGIVDEVKVYTDSHTLTSVPAVPSTTTTVGTRAHYECSVCGKKFSDAAGEVEVTDAQLAYAKLTDIKCQRGDNVDDATKKDIRFVAYVDDYTQYQSVTFTITCEGLTGSAICTDVYTAIYADGVRLTTEDVYGTTEGYFATFILAGNSADDLEKETTVTVTWKALDGTETTATRTISSFN